jgi:hypothetical protein
MHRFHVTLYVSNFSLRSCLKCVHNEGIYQNIFGRKIPIISNLCMSDLMIVKTPKVAYHNIWPLVAL